MSEPLSSRIAGFAVTAAVRAGFTAKTKALGISGAEGSRRATSSWVAGDVDRLTGLLDEAETAREDALQDVADVRRDLAASEAQRATDRTVAAQLVAGLRKQVAALTTQVAALIQPADWTPAALGFIPRPNGPGYVRIEDIPGAGMDLRVAAAHQAADGKVITLPAGTFTLKDFAQGDGQKFMHGLMVNPSVGRYHCRGFVGSGEGTVISMVPNSSHFTTATGASATGGTTQFVQNTILFYGVPDVEFGNLILQGTEQPHFYHGFRSTGKTWVHHLKTMGAAQGGQNMPPGETYSCAVGGVDSLIEDCEFDGRRVVGGPPISSTVVATLAATNPTIRRCHMHDLRSGFGIVQWMGVGLTTEDVWVTRPGTGTSGWNGAHTNHEIGTGPIRHTRPHITLDGYWGTPQRHKGKFPHFIFLAGTGGRVDPELYADVQIIDPVFDQWGATKGGFAVMLDEIAAKVSTKPKVQINGQWLTGVTRPSWWLEQPTIDTTSQYWIGANSGNGSVWG